ncbi:hypothetical protein BDAP_000050 [Binucleata daphniae]
MTILYTQILELPDYKISACSFSLHGECIQTNTKILQELRNVVQGIPDKTNTKIYDYVCGDKQHTFYIKIINDYVIATITDSHSSLELIDDYMNKIVSNQFNNLDLEAFLKSESDKYNENSEFIEADIELNKTKYVCAESLNKLVQRGEVIDHLEDITIKLREAGQRFRTTSRNMYYNDVITQYSIYVIIIVVLLILYYLFIH